MKHELKEVTWRNGSRVYYVRTQDWNDIYDMMMLYDYEGQNYHISRNFTPTMCDRHGYMWVHREDLKEK